jgi:hypothetical protein
MARKPPGPNPSRTLTASEKTSAIARLEARIVELRDLAITNLQRGDDQPVTVLGSRIRSTLANIYGQDSAEYDRLQIAAKLDTTNYIVELNGRRLSPQEIQQGGDRGRRRAISALQGEVDALREDLQFSSRRQQRARFRPCRQPRLAMRFLLFMVVMKQRKSKLLR